MTSHRLLRDLLQNGNSAQFSITARRSEGRVLHDLQAPSCSPFMMKTVYFRTNIRIDNLIRMTSPALIFRMIAMLVLKNLLIGLFRHMRI